MSKTRRNVRNVFLGMNFLVPDTPILQLTDTIPHRLVNYI